MKETRHGRQEKPKAAEAASNNVAPDAAPVVAPAVAPAAAPAAAPVAAPAAAAGDKPARGKKIRRMKLAQVEKAIAHARSTMGGETSLYIRHLLARKAELEAKKV